MISLLERRDHVLNNVEFIGQGNFYNEMQIAAYG